MNEQIIPYEAIKSKIFEIRGFNVMLDRDLADLFKVETRRLNERMKRNLKRFPADFMFQVSKQEFDNLMSQFATSSWGGIRKHPIVFTRDGIVMLAHVLKSDHAINMSIQITRAFNRMYDMLSKTKKEYNILEDIQIEVDKMKSENSLRFKSIANKFEFILQEIRDVKYKK